jgi:hypothetical protein
VKYASFVDAVLEAQQFGVMGRNIHMNLGSLQGNGKKTGKTCNFIKNKSPSCSIIILLIG